MGEPKIELETRRNIYEVIKEYPGLHMRAIQRKTDYDLNLVKYHLRKLENERIISEIEKGGYKRYFPKESDEIKIDYEDKKKLSFLRNEKALGIVLFTLKNEKVTHKELKKEFDMAASTLSYHLKKLVKNDILVKKKREYKVKESEHISRILLEYKPPEDIVEGFIDMWEDFSL
ncbi:MAG: winged helix-turn-helix transcriptional regulator [Thermoplasmata archaeon]